jgi:sarcosine oxidase subunit alpha
MANDAQPYRLASGGLIDRSRALTFRFDGATLCGLEGDTLASALLANGVRTVARSFKYHRARGVYTSGAEEPNALLTIGSDARWTPNTRATQVWLEHGLTARSQNRWPSLRWDVGSVNDLLSPLLRAGFYYKTFMRPRKWWPWYERGIRALAGMGRAPRLPDPDQYEKQYHHCDCLIVGLGPAGIAAALAASRDRTQRIIALDSDRLAGGSLLFNRAIVDGLDGLHWAEKTMAAINEQQHVQTLLRTTAFGYYDDNLIAAVESVPPADGSGIRERIHWIRARRVILATGSHERPLIFPGNDRPGILLASAARTYLNRYAVAPGKRVAILTNNDSPYALARELSESGVSVVAVIDTRVHAPATHTGLPVRRGYSVARTWGRSAVRAIRIERQDPSASAYEHIECDALCVSGGWTPAVQLHAQAQGTLRYDESLNAFVPANARQSHVSVGAATGALSTAAALREGWIAGGGGSDPPESSDTVEDRSDSRVASPMRRSGEAFVDLQNDVTAADIALAASEGFDSVEHLKRYTTLGMGTDQGKTSNMNGYGLLASATGREIASLGVTTFRPPYVPVTLGALAGHHRGAAFAPVRHSPLHEVHAAAGAIFVNVGLWRRPRCYPRAGESITEATIREARAVRSCVGIVDISTLGKIDLQGGDTAELLERVYCNRWRSLPIGKARYGLMLREDGIVLDDGTTSRFGPHHYFMTTSTANAGKVMSHLEYCLQVLWPELAVHALSVSEQWCAMALAGPQSRAVLQQAFDIDLGNAALPHLGALELQIAHTRARILRVSFSGELAYELYVPSAAGPAIWNRLLDIGASFGITAYGTDALTVLRVEKGHVAGPEIDGRTTPADLGLQRLRSADKHYIGRRLGERPGLVDPRRPALVGVQPLDVSRPLRAGAQLVEPSAQHASLGHLTSAVHSPTLGHAIALGLLRDGLACKGRRLLARDPLHKECVEVTVVDPVFVDPAGERFRV